MAKLRRIAPMQLPGIAVAAVAGPRPELRWVRPTDLLVDESYQRTLSPTSVRLIRTIAKEFAWSRVKPPVSVKVNGGWHVIDGQHTAIAAASMGLSEIPIFVVAAPEVMEQARAFVSHNKNRLAISALDIHRALVAGGDPLAASVHKACREVGIRLRYFTASDRVEVGDTQSIAHVQKLFKRHGVVHAKRVLRALVRAKCAPITEPQITAAHEMIAAGTPEDRLAMAVRVGLDGDLVKARAKAALDGVRAWQALRAIWERRLDGR